MRALVLFASLAIACAPTANSTPTPSASVRVSATPPPLATPTPIARVQPAPPMPTATPEEVDGRATGLIGALDAWCSPSPVGSDRPLPLSILARAADGRSARETVALIGRSTCLLRPAAYGDGATELVVVGAYRATGALLWVDRGFWRIAPVPTDFGYLELIRDHEIGGTRELLFTIWSGGSAGARGFLALALSGGSATVTLHSAPGATEMWVTPLGDTDLLITGRKHEVERPWGINSNCCIPGGHEWLWRWGPTGYQLMAERQARDSYYALNALLGALDAAKPASATDVARPSVISTAVSLFPEAPLWTYRASANANEQDQAELYRWSALSAPSTLAPSAVRYEVSRYGGSPSGPIAPSVVITFERIGDGWVATDLSLGTLN